jgi:hypothetical protein
MPNPLGRAPVDIEQVPARPFAPLYSIDSFPVSVLWRCALWLVLAALMRTLLRAPPPDSSFEQSAAIPQYAPYLPYSLALRLGAHPSPLRVLLAVDSASGGRISAPLNLSAGSRELRFPELSVRANYPTPVYEAPPGPGDDLLFTFGPGLSPANSLRFTVEFGPRPPGWIPAAIRLPFLAAMLAQAGLFALHLGGLPRRAALQWLTIALAVHAALACAPPAYGRLRDCAVACAALFQYSALGYFFALAADLAGGKFSSLFVAGGAATIFFAGRRVERDLAGAAVPGWGIEQSLFLALAAAAAVAAAAAWEEERKRLLWYGTVYGSYVCLRGLIGAYEEGFAANVSEFIVGKVLVMVLTTGHFAGGEKGYGYSRPDDMVLDLGAEEAPDQTEEGFIPPVRVNRE